MLLASKKRNHWRLVQRFMAGRGSKRRKLLSAHQSTLVLADLCKECRHKLVCAFAFLDAETKGEPTSLVVLKHYRPGQHVIDEGEPVTRLHLVCQGLMMVTVLDESGLETVLHLVGVGGILGATDNLLDGTRHSMSAKALAHATIAFIKPDVLSRLIEKTPSFATKFLREIGTQVRFLEQRYRSLHSHDAFTRTAQAFLQMVHLFGLEATNNNKVVLPIRLKRSILAQIVGATPETISRVMTQMRKKDLLQLMNHQIVIPSVQRLRDTLRL